jgi:hypothetical protein
METVRKVAAYKQEIEDLIRNFEYLDERAREDMLTYIASYFAESERDRFVEAYLDPTCR